MHTTLLFCDLAAPILIVVSPCALFSYFQIIANRSMAIPLRELQRLIRQRLKESRDMIGYDLAAMKLITRAAQERKQAFAPIDEEPVDIWAGLGLGSDVAAALQARGRKRS
jgi:hypothetical protein